mmetsp:Transcript_20523/g.64566  ORF Transcript_20523/g.64566 Transcript_20523/m.64566 type:complete len:96 (-) Transcript_20523:53-340(-)
MPDASVASVTNAKKYAARAKTGQAEQKENGKGWWRMDDLAAAFKRYADDPDDAEASFFLAKARGPRARLRRRAFDAPGPRRRGRRSRSPSPRPPL